MKKIKAKFKRVHELAVMPKYAKNSDSGADVFSVENVVIEPGATLLVSIGLSVELPEGYDIQVRSRSGLSARGIVVSNSPGTIDNMYRGLCKVILHNNGRTPYTVSVGDRIAQFVIGEVIQAEWEEVSELSDTERGSGGFGSTGK